MEEKLVNRVAESGLITLDLATFKPAQIVAAFDLAPFLFMGQVLREKAFRDAMSQHDWESYRGKVVAVFCSTDAILPSWAFMLVAAQLEGIAAEIHAATPEQVYQQLFSARMRQELLGEEFANQRVILKGCGDDTIGAFAYLEATQILKPHVKTLMYGEPCSTVPVYKRKD